MMYNDVFLVTGSEIYSWTRVGTQMFWSECPPALPMDESRGRPGGTKGYHLMIPSGNLT